MRLGLRGGEVPVPRTKALFYITDGHGERNPSVQRSKQSQSHRGALNLHSRYFRALWKALREHGGRFDCLVAVCEALRASMLRAFADGLEKRYGNSVACVQLVMTPRMPTKRWPNPYTPDIPASGYMESHAPSGTSELAAAVERCAGRALRDIVAEEGLATLEVYPASQSGWYARIEEHGGETGNSGILSLAGYVAPHFIRCSASFIGRSRQRLVWSVFFLGPRPQTADVLA